MTDALLASRRDPEELLALLATQRIVVTKQSAIIERQRTRIAELEALYAGTVESKNHKILQEKYARLRHIIDMRKIQFGEWDE